MNLYTSLVINYSGSRMRRLSMSVVCGIKKNTRIAQTPNMRGKYGTELLETNYPISFHRIPDTRKVPFCWKQTVDVTKPNRNR